MEIEVNGKSYRVSLRIGRLIFWLLEHATEVQLPQKGRLEFNFAGEDVRPSLTIFY